MNDAEREQWVGNDEGLYHMQRRSRMSMRAFIRSNRETIDAVAEGHTGQRGTSKPRAYAPCHRREW